MPTYLVTDPQTGRKLRLTGDSPPSDEELIAIFSSQGEVLSDTRAESMNPAMSDESGIAAKALALLPPVAASRLVRDATFADDAASAERGLAGVGMGMTNLARGAGQLVGAVSQEDIQEANRLDAPLKATPAGQIGSVVGTIAPILPTAFIPGANTYLGSAAIGAGTGLLDPVAKGDVVGGKAKAATIGALLGAGSLAAGQGVSKGYGLVRDAAGRFTEQGSRRLAAEMLQDIAGGADNLANAATYQPGTVGVRPTLAEATLNPGIASMELARSSDPLFKTALRGQQDANRLAIINVLDDMRGGGGGAGIDAARAAREQAAAPLYARARQAGAPLAVSTKLEQLAERPAMQQAIQQARELAANRGANIGNPLESIEGLHYTKLALDEMLQPSPSNAIGRNARSALKDMQEQLVEEIGRRSPDYEAARQTYQSMSGPINQMEVADELYNKFVPALTESGLGGGAGTKVRADAYAQALRRAGDSVKNITGFDTTIDKVMSPEQLAALRGIEADLSRTAAADALGAAKGSPTNQNEVMNALSELTRGVISRSPTSNAVIELGKAIGPKSKVNEQVAQMLLDPQAYVDGAQIQKSDIGPMIQALRNYGINPALLGANAAQQ